MEKKVDAEKEPHENDQCMMGTRKNGDAAGQPEKKKWISDKKRSFNSRVKGLQSNRKNIVIIILCIILIILFIVVIALSVQLGAKSSVIVPYCKTSQCLSAAATVKAGVDETVDPCEDLWNYACGNWLKNNPVPYSRGEWGVKDLTTKELYIKFRHLIDVVPYSDKEFYRPEVKIRKFYSTCINLNYIDSSNAAPLINIIGSMNGWDVFGTFSSQTFLKNKLIRDLHVDYGVTPYFKIDVVPSPTETGNAIIRISQSGLGMADASMYSRAVTDPHAKAYRTFILDLLQSFERTNVETTFYVDNIYYYEQRIAEITLGSTEEIGAVDEEVTILELEAMASEVSWKDLLSAYFPDAKITPETKVLIQSRTYLEKLSAIISSTDDRTMNNYLIWRLVSHYSRFLSRRFRYVYHKYDELLIGSTEPVDRWQLCMDQTNRLFGPAMGALYIRSKYDDNVRDDLSAIAKTVIDSFADNVRNLRWMDGRTKESAGKKVKEIMTFVGYAAFILSEKNMLDYYQKFEVQGSYFKNILNGVTFHRELKQKKLIDGIDGSKSFPEYAQNHNIEYNLIGNNLVVPYGVLELPHYNSEYPTSLRYGSIGVMMAQKIARSIDQLGSRYNEFGIKNMWWGNITKMKYNSLKDCMIDMYDQYELKDIQVNGNLTALNNIDDVIGLKQAYKAYLNIDDDSKSLAGAGLNGKQQFFVSYAQTLCQNAREIDLKTKQNTDTRPPNQVRVMASVSLLPEFRSAFKCTYRSPQCIVW